MRFLAHVSREAPDALRELVALDPDDGHQFIPWAKRWRFVDGWLYETARSHARTWRANPQWFGQWLTGWAAALPAQELVWEPGIESEAAFRRRVDAYIEARRVPIVSDQHLRWLARYQIRGEDVTTIAANAGGGDAVNVSSVSEALEHAAAAVGLQLRRGRRGPTRRKLRENTH